MGEFHTPSLISRGRIGEFIFPQEGLESLTTPYLFPVTSLMTGTTARGGGIWKYILQANAEHSFMRNQTHILSETLHFLDYALPSHQLDKWRSQPIRERYKQEVSVDYRGAIFLDSGGFRLMWRDGLDLSAFGIDLSPNKEAESILRLQLDLGANLVASLDYPLPPGLSIKEQIQRMQRSQTNALHVAQLLREEENPPFLFMPVHGQTPEHISEYVENLFKQISENDLEDLDFGIAIGSLVPMRGAGQLEQIIRLVWATAQSIPEDYRHRIPIHTFGLSGVIMPFLHYCGVDTFDSSTYIQEATNFKYTDPNTRQARRILDMRRDAFTCQCPICQHTNLEELQDALVAKPKQILPNGYFKSKYYADLALHNLFVDTSIIDKTKQAIETNCLGEYLIQTADQFSQMRSALITLAEVDPQFKQRYNQKLVTIAKPIKRKKPVKAITLTHTSEDFNINNDGYSPKPRTILMIIPCSAEKPYSTSTSHRFVQKHISEAIPNWRDYIHKVSLSGLYGPVPEEKEREEAVSNYDFLLKPESTAQIELCTARLIEYLNRYQDSYSIYIAYGTSKAYRTVFEQAAKQFPKLELYPKFLKARKSNEFYRLGHIQALVSFLKTHTADI